MNLLVTGAIKFDEAFFCEIKNLGNNVTYVQDERITLTGVNLSDIDGIICNGLFLSNPITAFPNLKYIQLTSSGYDRAPMEYIVAHNIEIFNARGVYSVPIAESVICGVLQIYKHSRFFLRNQERKLWIKQREQYELEGKSVCIVGCGSVGAECAKRFSSFGCFVTGIDKFPKKTPFFETVKPLECLDKVVSSSDIVVLTLPLTEETYHLFDERRINLLGKTSVLVNVSRGAIIDEKALESRAPHLLGVVLDVFEKEPLSDGSTLWGMDNVIITPHNSFVGDGNSRRLQHVILDNLKTYLGK